MPGETSREGTQESAGLRLVRPSELSNSQDNVVSFEAATAERKERVMERLHDLEDELSEDLKQLVRENRGNASVLAHASSTIPDVVFKISSLTRELAGISMEEWRTYYRQRADDGHRD